MSYPCDAARGSEEEEGKQRDVGLGVWLKCREPDPSSAPLHSMSAATVLRDWVREYQTPISKIPYPQTEDDVRNIAKTNFFSKQYESFIGDWILPINEPFLDLVNVGGSKDHQFHTT